MFCQSEKKLKLIGLLSTRDHVRVTNAKQPIDKNKKRYFTYLHLWNSILMGLEIV